MRLNEIFQPIEEIKMGGTQLSKTLQNYGDIAKVGFEFEIVVDGRNFSGENEFTGASEDISRIDDYEELLNYFNIHLQSQKMIRKDFSRWQDDEGGDIDDWIEDVFNGDFEDFIHRYGLEPEHGWVHGPDEGIFYTEEPSSKLNQQAVFIEVRKDIEEYEGMSAFLDKVEADGSIEVEHGYQVGVEIVTSPIPLDEVEDVMGYYLRWIKRNGDTNESTGLHVNVSIDGMEIDEVDWVKVGVFLGERYVLDMFNRLNNMYAREQLEKLTSFISSGEEDFDTSQFEDVVNILNSQISREKYTTFNITKNGYVEFRASGGTNYHLKQKEIFDIVLRYVRILALGMDKKAARKEYMKKVAKLISNANITPPASGNIESTVNTMVKKILEINQPYKTEYLPELVYEIYIRKLKIPKDIRRFFRLDARKNKITLEKFKNFALRYEIVPNVDSASGFFDFAEKFLALK